MSKSIQVCPAVGKPKFMYACQGCDKWAELTRYEPTNEAQRQVDNGVVDEDKYRFFIGPTCSVECLQKIGDYEVVEVGHGRD
jgi:hypothetical protein